MEKIFIWILHYKGWQKEQKGYIWSTSDVTPKWKDIRISSNIKELGEITGNNREKKPWDYQMKIQIDPHTLERAEERGTEVLTKMRSKMWSIQDSPSQPNMGKQEKRRFMNSSKTVLINIMKKNGLRYFMLILYY